MPTKRLPIALAPPAPQTTAVNDPTKDFAVVAAGLAKDTAKELAAQIADFLDEPAKEPMPKDVRIWARSKGYQISDRARIPKEIWAEYRAAHLTTYVPRPIRDRAA